jgi:hypothetical protein
MRSAVDGEVMLLERILLLFRGRRNSRLYTMYLEWKTEEAALQRKLSTMTLRVDSQRTVQRHLETRENQLQNVAAPT